MTRLNVNDARCEALFVSGLQRSDVPTPEALAEVISRTVRQFGITGCLSRMAQEFGDRTAFVRDTRHGAARRYDPPTNGTTTRAGASAPGCGCDEPGRILRRMDFNDTTEETAWREGEGHG